MNTLAEIAPMAGLLFFFTVFTWIALRTYRPSVKKQIQDHGLIPLKEDTHG